MVHRSTFRTFGKGEEEELETRLDQWEVALEGVLASDQIAVLKEQEQHLQVGTGGGRTTVTTNGPVVNGGWHQVAT